MKSLYAIVNTEDIRASGKTLFCGMRIAQWWSDTENRKEEVTK
jgi:hypothetical protein